MRNIKSWDQLINESASKDLGDDLMAAVINADEPMCEKILDEGADPNATPSPLLKAISMNGYDSRKSPSVGTHSGIIRLLLERGANPNIRGSYGNTPLHKASFHDQADIVRILLYSGANPNMKNKFGATPLHVTTSSAIASNLIGAKSDVNAKDSIGAVPLHYATQEGFTPDLIDLFLSSGADPNVVDRNGISVLDEAFKTKGKMRSVKAMGLHTGQMGRRRGIFYRSEIPKEIVKRLVMSGADISRPALWDEDQKIGVMAPDELLEIFDGDISWLPDGPMKKAAERIKRGIDLFGED